MGDSETFSPAPGRGQYDRHQTREQRLSEQRDRLLAATARILVGDGPRNVARVIALAGVGRSTFYEYFDDLEHAQRAALAAVAHRVEESLAAAERRSRTPVERLRALAAAWLAEVEDDPAAMLLALVTHRDALSLAGSAFERAIARALEVVASSGVSTAREPLRVRAVAAAAEAFARPYATACLAADPAPVAVRIAAERVLVNVAVRLLR